MHKNPSIIVISLVNRFVADRTTLAEFAAEVGVNALRNPEIIDGWLAQLQAKGDSLFGDFMIIDVTPSEADIDAWFTAKLEANKDLPQLDVGYGSLYHSHFVAGIDSGMGRKNFFASTLETAIQDARAAVPTVEQLAEQKREAARKLMAEADAISPPVYAEKQAA